MLQVLAVRLLAKKPQWLVLWQWRRLWWSITIGLATVGPTLHFAPEDIVEHTQFLLLATGHTTHSNTVTQS